MVREAASSVDLHDRKPLPVLRLEGLVAGNVHFAQVEPELGLKLPDLLERAVAEVAAGRVVDDDVGYG